MKRILILVISIFIFTTSFSQNEDCPKYQKHSKKVESEKIAFLTEQLDLSVEEAQVFWPIYNEYHKKKRELTSKKRKMIKGFKEQALKMNDSETEKYLDEMVKQDLLIAQLKLTYYDKYKKVLSIKKVAELYRKERQFNRTLLKKLKHNQCRPE